ncbi:MAG: zinc-binding alcohol dehydrogenase [Chloroflexi bacterium]|nr:zinc-binding alcohol dehydrogenase [Chloroflexota bacterium]
MTTKTQRACVIRPGVIRLEPDELPSPASDEVLVRTTKTLISPGTERAIMLNLPGLVLQYPKSVGYSHVGEIAQVGAEVRSLKIGDRVASKSRHASHALVKEALCHQLAADLDDEHATFFQLLATSLQAVRKTRLELGEAVAVLGAGLVGQLALQVARVAGAMPVVAIDNHQGRLKLAHELGADHIVSDANAAKDATATSALAERFPVVVEATGNPAALMTACDITAFGGRIALLGSSRGATESFDFYKRVHKKGITLIGAHIDTAARLSSAPGWWTLRDEQHTALKLLQNGRVTVAPLISHRFHCSEIAAAYDLLADWNLDALGILIDWT